MQPYWDSVLGVIGTRQVHSVQSRGHRTVLVAQVSTAKKFRAEVFLDDESSDSNISSRSLDEISEDETGINKTRIGTDSQNPDRIGFTKPGSDRNGFTKPGSERIHKTRIGLTKLHLVKYA